MRAIRFCPSISPKRPGSMPPNPWPNPMANGSRHCDRLSLLFHAKITCVLGAQAAVLPVLPPHAPADREPPTAPAPSGKRRLQSPQICLRMFFRPCSKTQHRARANYVWRWFEAVGRIFSPLTRRARHAQLGVRRTGTWVYQVQRIERWITRSRLLPKPSKQERCQRLYEVHSEPLLGRNAFGPAWCPKGITQKPCRAENSAAQWGLRACCAVLKNSKNSSTGDPRVLWVLQG